MSQIKYIKLIELINTYSGYLDIIKGRYLLLLSELTSTSYIENDVFLNNIERINNMGTIFVAYISEPTCDFFEIVSSGTIIIEPKIIRSGKNVGHIEDIVVKKEMRGNGISQEILNRLKLFAKENDCYKIILDCDPNVKNVYIKNGLQVKGLQMTEYFL